MYNLLFICRENRFRSVLAAQFFASLMIEKGLTDVNVGSAGTWAKNGLDPALEARRIAEKYGLDLEHVKSRIVDRELLERADLIVVMTENQKEALCIEFPAEKPKIVLLSMVCDGVEYDISDPFEDSEETVENIGDEIFELISRGFDRIYESTRNPKGDSF